MAIDQIKLNPQLTQFLAARQSALKIVKTTTTPSGQTLDWVPIESQDPAGKIASAPPVMTMPVRTADNEKPVKAVSLELDDPKVERGPAGTVPLARLDISKLTRTFALTDFLNKSGGLLVNKDRPNKKPTDPNPAGYFHETDSQSVKAYGADGFLSVWDPKIDLPSAPGDDHSILQFWLQNYDKPQLQSIEGGWTVDQNLNGDSSPHVFTYYTTNGYTADGNNQGGYNSQYSGWVQYSNSVFPGIRINGYSTYGGPQYDISMKFQLYREPTNGQLNWWIAVQGVWMGYYPASLFNGGVGNDVEWIGSGGEVFSSLSNPAATQDQMGSGWQAQCGWTRAAFLRNLRNQSDLNGTMVNDNGVGVSDIATKTGADPYTIQMFMNSGGSWGSYFYLGGPTACAPPQATFNQITFTIETGGDDLRGDSSATASVVLPGGNQTFTLKAQSDPGWPNNSDHVKTFTIAGAARPLSDFGDITITLTSHNSWTETDDNWNIQNVSITLTGSSGSACLYNHGSDPLARLTGSAPSVTLKLGTGC
ncbi:MAG: neprosin family prolyl endopeptidase [Terriglobia bacterium]